MCRKRVKITIAVLTIFLLAGIIVYLQWGRDMDVYSTFSVSSNSHSEEHIIFLTNKFITGDKETCAKELVKKCRENSFRSVLFSYDQRKPTALYGTVYRYESEVKTGQPVFTFRYIQTDGKRDLQLC